MIKLVLTDLDNTLISHAHGNDGISDAGMDAVIALIEAGVHFGPVSGRTQGSMAETFRGDERAYATGAYANGQLVQLDGEVIYTAEAPAEPLQRVADLMDELGEGALALYNVEDGSAWFVTRNPSFEPRSNDKFATRFGRAERVEGPSLKANIHLSVTDQARMFELQALLRREVPELDFVFPANDHPLLDILPKGEGKGTAVRVLAQALGISLDEVAVFGDSENDLSMLEAVPNAVAVANASDAVKAAARWHIGECDDDAVADAFQQIAAAAKTGTMPAFMA